ncbi:Hypothetical protein HVIM_01278 [Roseomonas mucosa]|uniref:Uncharacterized protein n=1 Tax=Roseomonas mucosa TaxID=207340 RepID=A0A1S8D133_9PROT|nr:MULTISPECIES: hypothetical protein [Roseomonas]MBS5902055.1 hypothetical protein [Acetobacteraceae bacterium]MCG7352327.1 hypothetical protein [Roseomonas mucosa]MCG7357391.1 hypothetical protein [Roseomonas mucosa]MDT8288654.1 hypothetical protein [Roseomonas mucosa]MDT8292688.1 hypothetical protein [Roseomonas mucosa]
MVWNLDARIPLSPLPDMTALQQALQAGPPAALLLPEGHPSLGGAVATARFQPFASHAVACACCGGRSPVAQALDRLFLDRVRGTCPWFDRVLALADTPEAAAMLQGALRQDAVVAARFRRDGL